jgi:hypothetical protein
VCSTSTRCGSYLSGNGDIFVNDFVEYIYGVPGILKRVLQP